MAVPEAEVHANVGDRMFDVVDIFSEIHPDGDVALIGRAYEAAAQPHAGQMRQTGDPYITHPLIVTNVLAEYGMDAPTLVAAILHDVVEDTEVSLERQQTTSELRLRN